MSSKFRLTLQGLVGPITAEVEISDELAAQIEADQSVAQRIVRETMQGMLEKSAAELARQMLDGTE